MGIKTVVEFGPGLSTLILLTMGCEIDSYEYAEKWYNKYKELYSKVKNVKIGKFNKEGEIGIPNKRYDLAFVDSPVGTAFLSRLITMEYAMKNCNSVIFHDIRRPGEKETIEYMRSKYTFDCIHYEVGIGFSFIYNINEI